MDARIIEEKIYDATGRVVNGKSVIEEIERAAGNKTFNVEFSEQ